MDTSWELETKLEPGMLRFLAYVLEDGLQAGLRTQDDFIRHFPPAEIMKGLARRPDLRANILVPTTGVRAKIALKKSAESSGHDLQIALDEGETDAGLIVSLFHPDDRVRYLDQQKLWNYISEPKFWTWKKDDTEQFRRAKSHIAFILDRAIEEDLLTYRDIVDGITVATMVQCLPLDQLQRVIETALSNSHNNATFTEQDLLNTVPATKLVDHIPLPMIWERVICPKVAEQSVSTNGASHDGGSNQEQAESLPYDQPGLTDASEDSSISAKSF